MDWVPKPDSDTSYAGTEHQEKAMEAIQLKLLNALPGMQVQVCYKAHIGDIGWMNAVCSDNQCPGDQDCMAGTVGQHKELEAIVVWLNNAPRGVHVNYEAYVPDSGWLGLVCDNVVAGIPGHHIRMEAFHIKLASSCP
jgi:uncharacterized protein YjdB